MAHPESLDLAAPRSLLRALAAGSRAPSLTHTLVRPDDQVRLRFELVNGTVDPKSNTILPLLGEEPIYYQIWFGAQHRVEEPASGDPPSSRATVSRTAAESRIVVEIPEGTPFTVASLLDLAAFALKLDERATDIPGSVTGEPAADVTAIEVPASLVLSPTPGGRFLAETEPVEHAGVAELWRARLGGAKRSGVDEPPVVTPHVRAIWNRAGDASSQPNRPVDSAERDLLVAQTTGKQSAPIAVRQLWLSSQGAFADVDGEWGQGLLAAYRHRVVSGRDLRVEVVERGYLAPFGHPASVTTLTERVFAEDGSGEPVATLVSEEFIAIGQAPIDLPAPHMPNEGRKVPFTEVTAADPGSGPVTGRRVTMPNGSSINRDKARILVRDGADLRIAYTAVDAGGQAGISFELPAVFVADTEAYEPEAISDGRFTVLDKLSRWYADDANLDFSLAELGGQAIAWAQSVDDPSRGSAGSVQTTNRIRFDLDRPVIDSDDPDSADTIEETLRASARPAFYPGVAAAWVVDLASSTGFGGDPPEVEVNVARRYLDHGVSEANLDLGYLDLAEDLQIVPTTDATGLMSTSLVVESFSQGLGAGVDLSSGTWDPWAALGDLGGLPTLLGNLTLADLVAQVNEIGDLSERGLPKTEVEIIPGGTPTDPPAGVCLHFSWVPELPLLPTGGGKQVVRRHR